MSSKTAKFSFSNSLVSSSVGFESGLKAGLGEVFGTIASGAIGFAGAGGLSGFSGLSVVSMWFVGGGGRSGFGSFTARGVFSVLGGLARGSGFGGRLKLET